MFENFKKPTKEEWIEILKKELKGADFDKSLQKYDVIEDIKYPSFFHQNDIKIPNEVPGQFPFKRALTKDLNDWSIVSNVGVMNEKNANKKALNHLMNGSTALYFTFYIENKINLVVLLNNIECQYIKLYFEINSESQFKEISTFFEENLFYEVYFAYNPLKERKELSKSDFIQLTKGISKNFEIDAYSIQQAGANCSQELAFAITLGHDYLHQQVILGRSIDESIANIHFTFGVGSNFLFEIAKLRAFRLLWSKITNSYNAQQQCIESVSLTSKIGFLNKSLKDPYTNLLRQTTEIMSAVFGGASQIHCLPYDSQSNKGSSDFTERMATNISLILKEESYLNQVLDAVGGSYSLEQLTEQLADKTWNLFQEIEKQGGLKNSNLIEQISNTAQKRVELYQNKQKTLIGVNKFPCPDVSDLKWKVNNQTYFGLKQLILENELN
jgi:methylmalonyl-CoA mutase